VGRLATPLPMKEVLQCGLQPDAILVYEQWGWPVSGGAYRELHARFPGARLIQDRVDSCHWIHQESLPAELADIQVISLSKQLGLAGGGLCLRGGEFLYDPTRSPSALTAFLLDATGRIGRTYEFMEFFKNHAEVPHPAVQNWFSDNDVFGALEDEIRDRVRNLTQVANSRITETWPDWMRRAVTSGAAPGIVPLFAGERLEFLQCCAGALGDMGINTELYHFDIAGNPLCTDYRRCLCVPIHGEVPAIDRIVEKLEELHSLRC